MRTPIDQEAQPVTKEWRAFWHEKHLELGRKGWLFPTYPTKYGGGGLTADHETILMEEFQRARVPGHHADGTTLSTLLVWGTEEQKQKFLVPLLKGEKTSHQKLTEPQSGADQANVKNRAVRDGDDWLISGENVFISTYMEVNWLSGQAMTDPNAPRHRNTGFFIIENPSPGLLIKEMDLLVGHGQKQIYMDNVRVPGDHLIGGATQGWQVMGTLLEAEHGGRGRAAPTDYEVEGLVKYVQANKSLGADPVIAERTVAAKLDAQVGELLTKRTFWMYQSHMPMQYESNLANVFQRHYTLRNAIRIREVMGLYSLLKGSDPLAPNDGRQEVAQRGRAGQNHAGGSTNIAKVVLARRIGISRTKERAAPTPSTVARISAPGG
jgi:alkylation response protein AidB-like acyl-CoA dehydrogenase